MNIAVKKGTEKIKTREDLLKDLIKKYSLEAIWLKNEQEFKNHLNNLNNEIAANCNKISTSFSIKDVSRILTTLEDKGKVLGLGNIRFDRIEKIHLKYQSLSPLIDMTSFIYSVAMAAKGNPNPIIRKLFIKTSNKVNANYVALTYIIGHFSLLLYGEDVDLLENISVDDVDPIDSFDPIIKLLNIDHIKDLSKLLKLDIDINLPIEEARLKVINELSYHSSNKVKYLYNKTFGENTSNYKSILLALSNDLKVEVNHTDEVNQIEEKLVMRVLQETVEKLTPEQKVELEVKLASLNSNVINKELLTSGGTLAAIIGLKASGFGVYLAASSALGALSNGLGISLAFSTYTTMSTVIAGFLGPVGIGAAGLGLIASLSTAEPRKVLPAIIYIAMLRKELEIEELQEVKKPKVLLYSVIAIFTIVVVVAILKYFNLIQLTL